MKSKQANEAVATKFDTQYWRSCQTVIAQIRNAKDAIFAESREVLNAPERILRLALNEAEALAWQTAYPHLVFPILATEKIQEDADWRRH